MTNTIDLRPGQNRLPSLFNPSVRVGEKSVTIHASVSPAVGTTHEEGRDPNDTIVALLMDWPDALRLALSILSMAQAARQPLPEGVVVPDREWISLTSRRGKH